jgi:sporulation integral membrane protein YtvI
MNAIPQREVFMPENKHLRRALYCLYGAAAIAIAWLVLRFLLPWLLPFILAFVIARLMEPAVRFLSERYSIRRGFASAMCTLVVFAVLIALTSLIIGRAVIELTALVKDLPTLLGNITRTVGVIGGKIDGFVKSAPAEIQNYLNNAIDGFNAKSAQLPAELSGKVLDFLSHAAKFTPRLILFFFACALGSFFISCGYKEFTGFILRQVPKRRHKSLGDFKNDLLATFGKWIKAELMLAGITFAEMTVAFLILRIEFAILLALLVAVVDLLPVVGSGAVLIPWALVSLIGGNYKTAVTLGIVYAVNIIVRNLLEPRLIGRQIGLPPIVTLIAIYVGYSAIGVSGMILFPIALIMVKHLNDKGI